MTRLGAVIAEAIVQHYGRDEFLRRLASPFWFQSFGAVMGMDWHSSGITTSVIGALKRGLAPLTGELGIHVCGGRGNQSRKTPDELTAVGERAGIDGLALATTSRLVAKVDSAALQDGFDLYLHGFIVTDDGKWVVVQQGMNGDRRQARRYHWLSEGLTSFLDSPHAAIEGRDQGRIVNLADCRADASRKGQLDLLATLGPDRIVREVCALEKAAAPREADPQPLLPHLVMPAHHDVRETDVDMRRLHGNIAAAAVDGRIVQIAFLGGSRVDADFQRLMVKRLTWTGSTLRARPDEFKARLAAEVRRHVWPLVESGEMRPVIDRTFPLAAAAEAHRRMESSENVGKIVLTI